MIRRFYTSQSFAILNDEVLKSLIKYIKENNITNIVEVGAGKGLYSRWLDKYRKNNGLDLEITAVDEFKEDYFKENNKYYTIKKDNAIDYVKNYEKDNTMFISSWPSLNTTFATKILQGMDKDKNHQMLYLGETESGCTRDYSFFHCSDKYADELDQDLSKDHKTSDDVRDTYMIFKKHTDFSDKVIEDNLIPEWERNNDNNMEY